MYKDKKDQREFIPDDSEKFPAVYIIRNLSIQTEFSLREICLFSLEGTVRHHAKRYRLDNKDFIYRIEGIHDCWRRDSHSYYVKRNGWIEYAHVCKHEKFIIHSSNLTR